MTKQMGITYHSAVVFVKDIEVSKQFYTKVLELVIELDFGKNVLLKGGITLWEINPNHIIPQQLGTNSIYDKGVNRFELFFETTDIETVAEKLSTSGVEYFHSVHEEPWGQRTVRFFDPDRHLIEIGELLETFVNRLHVNNMTPEQISRKTSIPLDKVRQIINGAA